jgi:inner membrane protein
MIPGMNSPSLHRHGVTFRLLAILVLVAILQIPLWLIGDLLSERAERRDGALTEITASWGRSQRIVGPFLVVPYRATAHAAREPERLAVFLPEQLRIRGELDPSIRHRGIYEAVVYGARLEIAGRFAIPDAAALGLAPERLVWDRAYLALGVDDLRGARGAVTLDWNGTSVPCEPGARHPLLPTGLHAVLPALEPGRPAGEFALALHLNGSGRLAFTPVGRETEVTLVSSWADPGFSGDLLPVRREIGPDGFDALWRASYFSREYAQQWTEEQGAPSAATLAASAFGVELVRLVDAYRVVERASKYALLFIALLFTAFFLFEILAALRMHVLHYALVGAALVLFYLALLAISEFAPFGAAYLVSAAASTLLITLYCVSILRSGRRSLAIGAALAGVYAFLFFVLRMQDYSLIAGTIALFALLALVMYATRNIDWSAPAAGADHEPDTEPRPAAPPPLPPERA